MKQTMHAVIFRGPLDFGIEAVPLPHISSNDILLKVITCGLCGSDLRTLKFGHRKVTPPFIIGHEICGEIVEVGSQASPAWKTGMRLAVAPVVYCGVCIYCRQQRLELCESYQEIGQVWPGGLAEYVAIPADALRRGVINPLSPSIDMVQAAVSEPLAACLHALEKVDFSTVRSAAIFGSGAIGCMLLQLIRKRGVQTIILIDPNDDRLNVAKIFHPDATINTNDVDVVNEIKTITAGIGVDAVFTATAAPIVQEQAIAISSHGGQIIVFSGLPKEQAQVRVDYNQIHYHNLRISGTSIYSPDHHKKALELIENGKINVKDIITTYPLLDFISGAKAALNGEIIKAVFIP
ncbi:MAG: alcohol dehydrogenase catalytic domain-containing protein [Pelolinea sp.]|jgi:L-iditol 2-dehydrogenase|nr:alcohol dehydrogenase catalytic domain-containing protein [Pelolinea sp.]